MKQLHNCPNCGGYLNDSGRCEFCGSKVYDFVNADFDKHTPTYMRIRYHGKIITMPIVINNTKITMQSEPLTVDYCGTHYLNPHPIRTGVFEFIITGDIIQEEEDANT